MTSDHPKLSHLQECLLLEVRREGTELRRLDGLYTLTLPHPAATHRGAGRQRITQRVARTTAQALEAAHLIQARPQHDAASPIFYDITDAGRLWIQRQNALESEQPEPATATGPKLGARQQRVLCLLRNRNNGRWWIGCGWLYDTHSGTQRTLDSLIKHGLVGHHLNRTVVSPRDEWTITPAGTDHATALMQPPRRTL